MGNGVRSNKIAKTYRLAVIAALYLGASYYVTILFLTNPGIKEYSRASYTRMVYQDAEKPFVKRALVPSLVRVVSEHSNPIFGRIVKSIAARFFLNGIRRSLSCLQLWEEAHRVPESLGIIIFFACFLGYGVLVHRLLKIFYEFPDLVSLIFPVFGLLALPVFFGLNYIYDPAVLFLHTLAVFCMVKGWSLAYYVVFAASAFNKETAILLIPLYFVWESLILRRVAVGRMVCSNS